MYQMAARKGGLPDSPHKEKRSSSSRRHTSLSSNLSVLGCSLRGCCSHNFLLSSNLTINLIW
jgi:hypothetical protein